MKPSEASSFRIAGGTVPVSSMSCAIGRSFSVAKAGAVRWTSSCESVRARSNAAPASAGSVLVVVVMAVLLIRVDADVPALGVAGEEVVALEFAADPEPDHEADLPAHLGRRLAIVRRVEHDVGIAGLQPARVRVRAGPGGE